jgi:hypothetical protein
MTKLFEESIGDQHDKAQFVDLNDTEFAAARMDAGWRDYMVQYRAHHASAAEELARVDVAIARASAAGDSVVKAVADSLNRTLPLEGRPLGFHITRTIREASGDAPLQAAIGDPVAWLEAYERATRQSLSAATMRLVRRLRP